MRLPAGVQVFPLMWMSHVSGCLLRRERGVMSACLLYLCLHVTGCRHPAPEITFTEVPEASSGGPKTEGVIAGHVRGDLPDSHIVVLAHTNEWWVQPDAAAQRIAIHNGSWTSHIHLGTEYAAVLVRGSSSELQHSQFLPEVNGVVEAVEVAKGRPSAMLQAEPAPDTLRFGGFEWQNKAQLTELDGQPRFYLPGNAFVDAAGALHLRIRTINGYHTCAEISMPQTLGYGTYRFTMRVPEALDPAAEFSFYIVKDGEQPLDHREMEVNLSRWGVKEGRNAEFVIEPYFVSTNVHGFEMPPGEVTTSLDWSPGRADFTSVRVGRRPSLITRWTFTTNAPLARSEHVILTFCPFAYPRHAFREDSEIVLRQFEFIP